MFIDDVDRTLKEAGRGHTTLPVRLIETWRSFVEQCRNGYHMCIYEYDNDISIREAIQLVIDNDNLKKYREYGIFCETIFAIDQKFRELLLAQTRDDRTTWWEKGILKTGQDEYATDIKEIFGIEIPSLPT